MIKNQIASNNRRISGKIWHIHDMENKNKVLNMEKKLLINYLSKQKKDLLLNIIAKAFDEFTTKQKVKIFHEAYKTITPSLKIEEVKQKSKSKLPSKIHKFIKDSRDGAYYSPFKIDSKNWSHIPDETNKWFKRLGDLLLEAKDLTMQQNHLQAIKCFQKLFPLIDEMESGDSDFIFADEYGSWMIPVNMTDIMLAYISSTAIICNPKEFAEHVIPLFIRDSRESFSNHVMKSTKAYANKEQLKFLLEELKNNKIKTQLY